MSMMLIDDVNPLIFDLILRTRFVADVAPPKMLQRRREAVFHSAAAAYRRLEPIFWQHNHCTTD